MQERRVPNNAWDRIQWRSVALSTTPCKHSRVMEGRLTLQLMPDGSERSRCAVKGGGVFAAAQEGDERRCILRASQLAADPPMAGPPRGLPAAQQPCAELAVRSSGRRAPPPRRPPCRAQPAKVSAVTIGSWNAHALHTVDIVKRRARRAALRRICKAHDVTLVHGGASA